MLAISVPCCSLNFIMFPIGSLPALSTKIKGLVELLCSKQSCKLNGGGMTYFCVIFSMTKSVMANAILSGRMHRRMSNFWKGSFKWKGEGNTALWASFTSYLNKPNTQKKKRQEKVPHKCPTMVSKKEKKKKTWCQSKVTTFYKQPLTITTNQQTPPPIHHHHHPSSNTTTNQPPPPTYTAFQSSGLLSMEYLMPSKFPVAISFNRQNSPQALLLNQCGAGFTSSLSVAVPPVNKKNHSS